MQLEFTCRSRNCDALVQFIQEKIVAANRLLRSSVRELSIAVVGDREMSRLHEQFMGVAGPTDVLTFELDHDRRGRVVSGEVVICLAEARRQARKRRIPVEHEALLYSLHGLLHLMGFDDRTEPDYRAMHRTEDIILTKLGIGQVFVGPPAKKSKPGVPVRRSRSSRGAL